MKVRKYKVFRCDDISSVDGFLSAKEVLKLEMFGDEHDVGFRNFDGVISDIKRLYPEIAQDSLFENLQTSKLEEDKGYQDLFTDELVKKLIDKCNIPEKYFNYGIWACDEKEFVVDSYGVDIEDVNEYHIEGILLQDLGIEGQLYGVANYPVPTFKESMIMTEKDFEQIFNETVTAAGASGIANCTPEHMLGVVDPKVGVVSNGSKATSTKNKGVVFTNDSMKVHKKKGKKGDAITGTGVVYANGRVMEALDKVFESLDCNANEQPKERYEESVKDLLELESVAKDIYDNSDNSACKAAIEGIYDAENQALKVDQLSIEKLDAVAQTCLENDGEYEAEKIWDAIADLRQNLTESVEQKDGEYVRCENCGTDLLKDEVVEIDGKYYCTDCAVKEYDKKDATKE